MIARSDRLSHRIQINSFAFSVTFQPETFAADPPDLLVHDMRTLTDYVLR